MARRVVSLIPSATEILSEFFPPGEGIVGVTHECDRPEWVRSLPRVVSPIDRELTELPPAEIDRRVRAAMEEKRPLYAIDCRLLAELKPDLVVTQRLCDVCTISAEQALAALDSLDERPALLELSPNTLDDIFASVLQIGMALGMVDKARAIVADLTSRLTNLQMQTTSYPLPRVLALEWTDPLWVAGHWVPDMIAVGGGLAALAEAGAPSRIVDFDAVFATEPSVVLVACCGYDLEKNMELGRRLLESPAWRSLPAVKRGHVYAVDANAHFSRPSPAVMAGIEAIADILHGSEESSAIWRRVAAVA